MYLMTHLFHTFNALSGYDPNGPNYTCSNSLIYFIVSIYYLMTFFYSPWPNISCFSPLLTKPLLFLEEIGVTLKGVSPTAPLSSSSHAGAYLTTFGM